ncbi:thioredoxin family protein [Wenzhouxiangella sp. AB-CW3]|uniref:thioredoxin family protein n=1 Tax=Wenzhouxiangella sp. AB-CW3 TaxID=2771012 RepID=UPI00168ACB39|nr:thioredoxin family protein [Wenzhouxiangella sp. AB-CW3]QOC22487.1 thioredoxin family protein [Wenzhouxiangella sp. AB-CW3]
MAKTESTMLPLGTPAPDFRLPDTVSGKDFSLDDAAGEKGTLVMFICNHCPFVKHVLDELARLGRDYPDRGIGVVAISSNDVTGYPQDRPERMAELAQAKGFSFPYLYDESQNTARAYDAACTPDFFVFDADRKLVYRGQLDDSRPGNGIEVTGKDLRAALDALIEGQPVAKEQKPSIGCNIKWKG